MEGGLFPCGPSGEECTEVFVGLVVNDGATGLAAVLDIPFNDGTDLTPRCFGIEVISGERGG